MEHLKHDWLTEGLIDYEYKKYILLAYLKNIRQHFNQSQLYPFLSDLVFHYRNLHTVKEQKKLLSEHFPKTLSHADIKKLKLSYDQVIKDDEVMKVMEEIIAFALPRLQAALDEGKELYEWVEEQISIESVGLTPIYRDEGYLFIHPEKKGDVAIYRYQLAFFEHAEEKYQSLNTTFVAHETRTISHTYESIKVKLARRFRDLPNPAAYLAFSRLTFPMEQTLLPVAKRMLVRALKEES
jgi:hypothetical protein